MYAKLNCKVTIETQGTRKETITFTALNYCEVEKSIYTLGSSAKLRIPASCRLRRDGKLETESVQTGKQFARGDKITIELGYGDDLQKEFTGFIYRVNYTTPLEVECEGYEFLLRTPCETKTWKSTTLKDVIEYVCAVSGITMSDKIPEVNMVNYVIPSGRSRLEAAQDLKEKYGLTAYFVDDRFYIGLAYTPDLGTVKYSLGVNTIKDNELKYHYADDVKLRIKAIGVNKDNTKLEAEIGDKDGSLRTLFFYDVKSQSDLKKLATQEIEKYKYTGYEGKITAFLQPFAQPGMKAELKDPKYSEREGTFYLSGTKVQFGRSGGRRQVELAISLL